MGNMEPRDIAKLVSSDVNQKLKPLPPSYQSPNTPHFQTLVKMKRFVGVQTESQFTSVVHNIHDSQNKCRHVDGEF